MSTAYLTRWTGPVAEADDPYDPLNASPGSTPPPARKHVQGTIFLPMRASALDNDLLKSFVGDAWVVYVSMMWVNSGYNAAHASFYNNGVTTEPGGGGHAVCIVGWDDDYPASNFNVAPPGNGAFIVRNSWGPSWGEAGYFYVSYYDTLFARRDVSAVILAEDTAKYSGVFQYDPLGWIADMGYGPGFETALGRERVHGPGENVHCRRRLLRGLGQLFLRGPRLYGRDGHQPEGRNAQGHDDRDLASSRVIRPFPFPPPSR